MADTFQSIFRSDLFTFLVGKDRKAIIVHSAAITEHSRALGALVNIGMTESQARVAILDNVDEDDFIRFCQFAYTGDYSAPPHTIEVTLASPPAKAIQKTFDWGKPDEPLRDDKSRVAAVGGTSGDLYSSSGQITKHRKVKTPRTSTSDTTLADTSPKVWKSWGLNVSQVNYQDLKSLGRIFESKKFLKEAPRQKLLDSCDPVPNSEWYQNFTPVFLAHARLYVFADKYGIEPLQQLTLQKLHQTLMRFELFPERVQDVVELTRFVYTEENTRDDGTDGLRALVAVYMVSRIDKLNASEAFPALLEEGGAFVRDFWLLVRNALYV